MSYRVVPEVRVRVCDRCSSEFFELGDAEIAVYRCWPDVGSRVYRQNLDLCSPCTFDLWRWVFGKDAPLLGDRPQDKEKTNDKA